MPDAAAKLFAAGQALIEASRVLAEVGVIELEPTILLTPAEAAEQLRVSTSLIYRLASEQRIPTVHISGALRIPRAELVRWLDANADQVGLKVVGGGG